MTVSAFESPLQKSSRLKRIQTVSLTLLFLAGIINFLDRGSLSIANAAIRNDLGLSATEFGVLLSAFSLSYGISQLPSGLLLTASARVSCLVAACCSGR